MIGTQCDTCRTFAPQPSPGWLLLARQAEPSFMSLLSQGGGTEMVGTFCSMRCVAEYAYAHAVIAEQPGTGTGWPG